jgi:PmbA protein
MFAVLDAVLERAAARGAAAVEVYGEAATSRRIKVYQQAVEELVAAQRRGLGVRVFRNGAVGYAYTSDLSDSGLDDVVRRAVDHAAVSDPDEHAGLPQPSGAPAAVTPFDPRLGTATDAQRIEIALAVEAAALAADPRVKTVEDTVYADADGEVFIASTAGVRGTYRANHCYAFAYVLAEQDEQVETGYSFTLARALEELDPAGCGREAATRACQLLGARKCSSMKVPVILDPFISASFFGVLSSALTADAVQKRRSLFAGREGERVASELLDLVDDGTLPDGPDSAPFDGEGTPCRRTPLISAGVLQGFLYDTYTAHKAGRHSTGNGQRPSYAGQPSVGPTNLVVAGPATPVADLLSGIDKGVLVTNVVGVHSGANPITGQFSVGMNGVLIEHGELTTPVREVTLAGDMLGMLGSIRALGDDARWIPGGSILTPSVLIDGMAISGT